MRQLRLWDEPLGNHGHCRTVIGNLAERLTLAFFGGVRHKTDSRVSYCPDVSTNGIYLEVKAAGCSNQTFIYSGRVQKDRNFAKDHPLAYVIWWHAAETKRTQTVFELESLVIKKLRAVFVVPWEDMDSIIRTLPEEKLNSKYGNSDQPGTLYGSGYRINIRSLSPFLLFSFTN